MTRFDRLFATAILSGVLAVGSGMSIAAAHHGDVSGHSTTKGKSLSEIEMRERQVTAELNRKQLMPQIASVMSEVPMQSEMPAMPTDEQAAVTETDQADIAAIENDEADVTN